MYFRLERWQCGKQDRMVSARRHIARAPTGPQVPTTPSTCEWRSRSANEGSRLRSLTSATRHFRSAPNSGDNRTGAACPKRTISRLMLRSKSRFLPKPCVSAAAGQVVAAFYG